MGGRKLVSRRRERARPGFFHCHPAAQRDRVAAHRPHARPHGDRYLDALEADARLQHAVPAGDRPRGNFDTARGGAPACRARHQLPRSGPRSVREEGMGMEGGIRRNDHAANAAARRKLRLDARAVHAVAGVVARGHRSLRATLRRRPDLSRPLHRELVPAMPHRDQRSRNRSRRAAGPPLAHPLPDCGDEGSTSSWQLRGPKRCWGTRLWPSIQAIRATSI